jgi:hypothetical protein
MSPVLYQLSYRDMGRIVDDEKAPLGGAQSMRKVAKASISVRRVGTMLRILPLRNKQACLTIDALLLSPHPMKKVSLFAALSVSALLAACQGSTGSVTDVNVDADMQNSSVSMMDDSSSSVEAMMDDSSSSSSSSDASDSSSSSSSSL